MKEKGDVECDAEDPPEVTVRRSEDGKGLVVQFGGATIFLCSNGFTLSGAQIDTCCLGPDGHYHIAGHVGRRPSWATGRATAKALPN